jgi:hypothetical protein
VRARAIVYGAAALALALGAVAAALGWTTPQPSTCSATATGDEIAFLLALASGLLALAAIAAVLALRHDRAIRGALAPAIATFPLDVVAFVTTVNFCFTS